MGGKKCLKYFTEDVKISKKTKIKIEKTQ